MSSIQDVDKLLDSLTKGIQVLREQDGESDKFDELETRLFSCHDDLMVDYATLRMNGGQILQGASSIDNFNIVRYEILVELQQLYAKLDKNVVMLRQQLADRLKNQKPQ